MEKWYTMEVRREFSNMKKLLILTIVLLSFPTSAFAAIGFMPSSDSAEIYIRYQHEDLDHIKLYVDGELQETFQSEKDIYFQPHIIGDLESGTEYEVELKFYDEDGELLDEDKSTIRTTNQSLNRFNYSCNIL